MRIIYVLISFSNNVDFSCLLIRTAKLQINNKQNKSKSNFKISMFLKQKKRVDFKKLKPTLYTQNIKI